MGCSFGPTWAILPPFWAGREMARAEIAGADDDRKLDANSKKKEKKKKSLDAALVTEAGDSNSTTLNCLF